MEEKIVFSAFDGMSCLQQALNRSGIHYDKYLASEIDKYAIKVTQANYPETVQMGSIVDIDTDQLPFIWFLAGGSPCQSFSFAGKRKGMSTKDEVEILTLEHYLQLKSEGYEFEGQSYLFWEYMRILTAARKKNPQIKFLLENVMMGEKWEKILTRAIGVNPVQINSALVSAQNRNRLYWTNIGMVPGGLFGDMESTIKQPKDLGILLKDVLENEVDEKYFLSEKLIAGFMNHTKVMKEKGNGFAFNPTDGGKKGKCLTARCHKMGVDDNYIVHNTMPRSSKSGHGGTGHLSRTDGKTYCLDTGNTNAIEIVCLTTVRSEEAKRIRRETGTNPKQAKEVQTRSDGKVGALLSSPSIENNLKVGSRIRRLTPTECERLQTVADGYTNHVSDTQRYKMLGNGWTIEVITHILSYIN